VAVHNTDVNGHTVKCSWGKESGDPNNLSANQVTWREKGHESLMTPTSFQLQIPTLIPGTQFPYSFAAGTASPAHLAAAAAASFYYPQPLQAAAQTAAQQAAQAAAAQQAQNSYLQGLQGYTFSNFGASYPQSYMRFVRASV